MATPHGMQQQLIEHNIMLPLANSDAGACLPLVVYRWLGDGAGPVPGHVATFGG